MVHFILQLPAHHEGEEGKEFKAGIRRQEQKLRPCRNIAYWLALHNLQGLIFYSTPEHLLGGDNAHCGLGFSPTSVINRQVPHRLSYRPI